MMGNLIAQNGQFNLGPGFSGFGPLGTSGQNAPQQFNQTISKIIGVITAVGFIWFTFQIIIGSVRIISSGGDKGAVEAARKQITSGLIGVVVLIAGIFIVSFIGKLFNIDILNPTKLVGL
jgi:hypothetical protein